MTTTCRVSRDELNHDLTQYGAEDFNKLVNEVATEAAFELICDGKQLMSMVFDYETPIFDQLARAMRALGNATQGDPIARDACLNALSQIEKIALAKAVELCRDEAERQVIEQEKRT